MSALREWAAVAGGGAHGAVAVSWLGKVKTAAQMAALTLLLAVRAPEVWRPLPPQAAGWAAEAGMPLLGLAAVLAAWSLLSYFAALWKYMAPAQDGAKTYRF